MTGRILLIGQEKKESKALLQALRSQTSFLTRLISSSENSMDAVIKFKPDAIVLIPEYHFEALRPFYFHLKKEAATADIPLIVVLSEHELQSNSLPNDLHEVFCRPLRLNECVSRLMILYRKCNRINDKNLIRMGALEMDVSKYVVTVDGSKVDLTYTEYQLLKFLMTNPEQVFNRDVLLNKVWGYEYYGGARTVDVHVRRLRSKVENGSSRFIETVRNIGYKFLSQDED